MALTIQPVMGYGMLPLLEEGVDAIKLNDDMTNIQVMDMVLVRLNKRVVRLSRVLSIHGNKLVIARDNSKHAHKIKRDKILAKVASFYRNDREYRLDDPEYIGYLNRLELDLDKRVVIPYTEAPRHKQAFIDLMGLLRQAMGYGEYNKPIRDWRLVVEYAHRQKVACTIAQTAKLYGCPKELQVRLDDAESECIMRCIYFERERESLYKAFDDAHIDYLPLKGILINPMYPRMGMRYFADNDILVRDHETKRVRKIFAEHGYKLEYGGGVHDEFQKLPIYNFEMHHRLFGVGSQFKNFFDEVDSIWDRVTPIANRPHHFVMGDLDFYFYFIAHMQKHHEGSGSNLRDYADLMVLDSSFNNDLRDELDNKLQRCGAQGAYVEAIKRMKAMFNGDFESLPNEFKAELQSYGMPKPTKGGLLRAIFPPYANMCEGYPRLTGKPILLPAFWMYRIVSRVFIHSKRKAILRSVKGE